MCTISLLAYKMFFERTHFDEQAGHGVWQLSTTHGPAKCTQIKAHDNMQVRVVCPATCVVTKYRHCKLISNVRVSC